jgi:cytochrome P450/NADPH-cytochrome P450 reductase
LLKNPAVLARAYDEVDRVLGTDLSVLPTNAQVHQVPYVAQILNETLRLWPTASAFSRCPYADTVIGGRYLLEKGTTAMVLVGMLHRDKQVWGEEAEEFDPDHFSPENQAKTPPNAIKPFGTGQRACIGRQFALQEATLVLSMLLQRFEFIDYTNYQLETKQTLTIKPTNFRIKVKLRARRTATAPLTPARPAAAPQPAAQPAPRLLLAWTRTVRRCWCCMARTSGPPRVSPTPSPRTRPTEGSPGRSGRSTTTLAPCPRRGGS